MLKFIRIDIRPTASPPNVHFFDCTIYGGDLLAAKDPASLSGDTWPEIPLG